MARPGRFELPTLCLEGRRSIQLSYGRAANSDSKAFTTGINTVLDALTFCRKGRRSIQLSSLPTQLILLELQRSFDIRFFRNHEQLGAFGMGGTMDQSELTLLPQTKLEFQIQARVSV